MYDCPGQFALFGALLMFGSDAPGVVVVRLKHALPASCMVCKGRIRNLRVGWFVFSPCSMNSDPTLRLISTCDVN